MVTLPQKDQKFETKWYKLVRCLSKQTHKSKENNHNNPFIGKHPS